MSGILLGPPLADWIPYPDALRLAGKLGILLLVMQSGLAVDIRSMGALFPRALGAAGAGVAAPVAASIAIAVVSGRTVAEGTQC